MRICSKQTICVKRKVKEMEYKKWNSHRLNRCGKKKKLLMFSQLFIFYFQNKVTFNFYGPTSIGFFPLWSSFRSCLVETMKNIYKINNKISWNLHFFHFKFLSLFTFIFFHSTKHKLSVYCVLL